MTEATSSQPSKTRLDLVTPEGPRRTEAKSDRGLLAVEATADSRNYHANGGKFESGKDLARGSPTDLLSRRGRQRTRFQWDNLKNNAQNSLGRAP